MTALPRTIFGQSDHCWRIKPRRSFIIQNSGRLTSWLDRNSDETGHSKHSSLATIAAERLRSTLELFTAWTRCLIYLAGRRGPLLPLCFHEWLGRRRRPGGRYISSWKSMIFWLLLTLPPTLSSVIETPGLSLPVRTGWATGACAEPCGLCSVRPCFGVKDWANSAGVSQIRREGGGGVVVRVPGCLAWRGRGLETQTTFHSEARRATDH